MGTMTGQTWFKVKKGIKKKTKNNITRLLKNSLNRVVSE